MLDQLDQAQLPLLLRQLKGPIGTPVHLPPAGHIGRFLSLQSPPLAVRLDCPAILTMHTRYIAMAEYLSVAPGGPLEFLPALSLEVILAVAISQAMGNMPLHYNVAAVQSAATEHPVLALLTPVTWMRALREAASLGVARVADQGAWVNWKGDGQLASLQIALPAPLAMGVYEALAQDGIWTSLPKLDSARAGVASREALALAQPVRSTLAPALEVLLARLPLPGGAGTTLEEYGDFTRRLFDHMSKAGPPVQAMLAVDQYKWLPAHVQGTVRPPQGFAKGTWSRHTGTISRSLCP